MKSPKDWFLPPSFAKVLGWPSYLCLLALYGSVVALSYLLHPFDLARAKLRDWL